MCRLEVKSAAKANAVRVWKAEVDDARLPQGAVGRGRSRRKSPAVGDRARRRASAAFFAETEYELDGLKFTLCTQIRILEAKK